MKLRIRTALLRVLGLTLAVLLGTYGTAFAAEATKIQVDNIEASPGASVAVDVTISGNPGILGTTLQVNYDSALTLTGAKNGEAFSPLTMTKPGKFENGCKFGWDGQDLDAADIKDGVILTLNFDVAATAEAGSAHPISVKCDAPVDVNLNVVDVTVVNGGITIAGQAAQDVEPESLQVSKDVTEYDAGSTLATNDLSVTVVYSDKTTKTLTASDYTVDSSRVDMSLPGVHKLVVSYTEGDDTLTAEVPITVNAVLESITAKMSKTSYAVGDEIDLSSLTVMATYTGGSSRKVTNFTTNATSIDMSIAGAKTLTITYAEGGKTATTDVALEVKPVLSSLEVTKTKTVYEPGETLALDDLTVKAVYLGQDAKTLSADEYVVDSSAVSMNKAGTYALKVSYTEGDVTVEQDVTITVSTELISLSAVKARSEFYYGDAFTLDDLEVKAIYSGNVSRTLEVGDYTVSDDDIDTNVMGEQWFTVSYTEGEKTVTAPVSITVKPVILYLSVSKTTVIYTQGSALDLSDLTVTAFYSDNTEGVVTDYETNASSIDMTKAGVKTLEVTCVQGDHVAKATTPIVVNDGSIPTDKIDIATMEASLEFTEDTYSFGLFVEPEVTVKGLKAGVDYVVTYANNINVGIGEARIHGLNDYAGTKTLYFTIKPVNITYSDLVLKKTTFTYTGKPIKPSATAYGANWVKSSDYTATYPKDCTNIGTKTVTITAKKTGNYVGSMKLTYIINPAKAAFKGVKAGSKSATVTLKAQKGGVKYQIQCRTGKGKWRTINTAKAKVAVNKLTGGKKYVFRVRAFKKVGSKTYYGAWSANKAVTIKK